MALFQWITELHPEAWPAGLFDALAGLSLVVDDQVSNDLQIYARRYRSEQSPSTELVTVLIMRSSMISREYQFEVRSSEPLLRRGTSCEQVALKLQQMFPPRLAWGGAQLGPS